MRGHSKKILYSLLYSIRHHARFNSRMLYANNNNFLFLHVHVCICGFHSVSTGTCILLQRYCLCSEGDVFLSSIKGHVYIVVSMLVCPCLV